MHPWLDDTRLHREDMAVKDGNNTAIDWFKDFFGSIMYVVVWFLAQLFITGSLLVSIMVLILVFWMVVLSYLGVVS